MCKLLGVIIDSNNSSGALTWCYNNLMVKDFIDAMFIRRTSSYLRQLMSWL